ncbi:hypothetical protein ACHAW5_010035 [Stephanodiscus triporus]|uniref:Uncharacterized protein n=1 Tax=Stephanodiscus triporus TaxID=2934178 RepID=A0ABD3N4J0_9STRA
MLFSTSLRSRAHQHSPPRRHSLRLKKAVQFSSMSEVCLVEPCDFSSTNWYSGLDHKRFKRERISDVLFFRRQPRKINPEGATSAEPADDPCCPVGLEQLLSKGSTHKAYSHRRIVIQTVLLEQQRQRVFGCRDPDKIAFLYEKVTTDSFIWAQKRGKFQEMAKFV